jgi:hypothetical protein
MRTKSAEMKYIKEHQSAFDAALARATLSIRQNAALVGLNKIREPLAFCAALKAINYPNAPAGFTPPKEAGEPTMELAMTAEALAHTPLSRDNKTGPGTQSGGIAHPGPHAPGEGASEFVSRGEPCLDYLASELAKHAKSADIFRHQRTELSQGYSGATQSSLGPTTRKPLSPPSCGGTSEPQGAGSAARSTRPPMSGPSCSPLRLIQTDLCGND